MRMLQALQSLIFTKDDFSRIIFIGFVEPDLGRACLCFWMMVYSLTYLLKCDIIKELLEFLFFMKGGHKNVQ